MTSKPVAGVTAGSQAPETWFHEGCFIAELMNNDNNPDLSIARARVPAGTTTRWHQLAGITERYVILSGSGEVEITGLPSVRVVAGDCVTIPAQTGQRVTATQDGDLIFLAICTPRFVDVAYAVIESPAT